MKYYEEEFVGYVGILSINEVSEPQIWKYNGEDLLIPISDRKWEWKGKGDNKGVVRKIESNWFYFEASF